jgi:hypothetical protein
LVLAPKSSCSTMSKAAAIAFMSESILMFMCIL